MKHCVGVFVYSLHPCGLHCMVHYLPLLCFRMEHYSVVFLHPYGAHLCWYSCILTPVWCITWCWYSCILTPVWCITCCWHSCIHYTRMVHYLLVFLYSLHSYGALLSCWYSSIHYTRMVHYFHGDIRLFITVSYWYSSIHYTPMVHYELFSVVYSLMLPHHTVFFTYSLNSLLHCTTLDS